MLKRANIVIADIFLRCLGGEGMDLVFIDPVVA
jgi:hypothetical protein